jgi:hypothetical protein
MRTNNRWAIAIAGVFFQIALGAVYAWSVFRVPLAKQFGWSISEVTADVYDQHFCPGLCRVLRRPLVESQRTAYRRLDRRRALRAGSFSGQLLT